MNYELTVYAIDHISQKSEMLSLNFHYKPIGSKAIPATTNGQPVKKTYV